MPWCPKCKNNYPEDSKECWTCGLPLIHADPEELEEIVAQHSDQPASGCIQVFVVSGHPCPETTGPTAVAINPLGRPRVPVFRESCSRKN